MTSFIYFETYSYILSWDSSTSKTIVLMFMLMKILIRHENEIKSFINLLDKQFFGRVENWKTIEAQFFGGYFFFTLNSY